MPDIDEETFKAVLNKRPEGMSADDGIRKMIAKGYTFNGKHLDPHTLQPIKTYEQEPSMLENAGEMGMDALKYGAEFVAKEGLPIAGAALGGAAGLAAGTPLGPAGMAGGAMGGAYIGGAAGRALTDASEAAVNLVRPGTNPEKTTSEVISGVHETGKSMAEGEALGGILGQTVTQTGKALLPALEKRAPNIVRAVKAAMSENILPSMAQITQSKPMAAMEEVASKIPYFGRRIQAMREAQNAAYDELRKNTLAKVGQKVEEGAMGAATKDAIEAHLDKTILDREVALKKLHSGLLKQYGETAETKAIGEQIGELQAARTRASAETAGKFYKDIDAMIPDAGNKVADDNIRAVAEKFHAQYENLPEKARPQSGVMGLLKDLKDGPGNKIIEVAPNPVQTMTPDVMAGFGIPHEAAQKIAERKAYTFQEMQTLKSSLTSMIRSENIARGKGSNEVRILSNILEGVEKDIAAFSDTLPGDIKAAKKVADAAWKEHKTTYGNKAMQSLDRVTKEHPEAVYKMFVKPNNASDIARLKTVVGEAGMAPIRQKFVQDMVTGPDGKMLAGPQIMKKMSQVGMETMNALLSPLQIKQLARAVEERNLPKFMESEVEQHLRRLIADSGGRAIANETIAQRVMDGDSILTNSLRNVVGPSGMVPYKRAVLEKIIGAPQDAGILPGVGRTPTAQGISKTLQSYDPKVLEHLGFGKEELAQIQKIDDIKALLESTQKNVSNASGSATSGAALMLTGAALKNVLMHPIASGAYLLTNPLSAVPSLATITIGPEIVSRFYTSAYGRKLLIDGMSEKFAKDAALRARIAAFALQAKREKANEDAKKQGLSPAFNEAK